MKFKFFTILYILIASISCTQEIKDFKFKNSVAQIVIDAQCSSLRGQATVRITKTNDILNYQQYATIDSAIITVSYNDTTLTIPHKSAGLYELYAMFPENTQYTLSVTIGDETYKAQSYMPSAIPLTRLVLADNEENSFAYEIDSTTLPQENQSFAPQDADYYWGPQFMVRAEFIDNPKAHDYYRLKFYKNYISENNLSALIVLNDEFMFADTTKIEPVLFYEKGDSVTCELMHIDNSAYIYYNGLINAASSDGNFSTPDNPINNFTGKVLGAFVAYASDTLTLIIP